MKKWSGLLLVTLLLVSVIAVYWLWPKTNIDQPVVVSAQIMESDNTMSVSYIVAKKDNTHLMEVAINGKGFYPPSRAMNGEVGGNTQVAKELAAQNGYQLREATIELTDEELAFLLPTGSSRILSAELSFSDYSPFQADFIMLMEEEAVEGNFEQNRLHYIFRAPEAMTVSTVGHYDSVATVSWSRDGREVKLPLVMEKGDTLDIRFDGTYQMASADALLLEIQTADDNYYTRHFRETLQLPNGYLKQIVLENRQ